MQGSTMTEPTSFNSEFPCDSSMPEQGAGK